MGPVSLARAVQLTRAVTPRPSERAWYSPSRVRTAALILSMMGDWSIPGVRREGEAKRMRRDGKGRTIKYYGGSVVVMKVWDELLTCL